MTQETITRINDFLTEAGVFFLATTRDGEPRLRPMGTHLDIDGKLLISVGDFKECYRQMVQNPRIEIVALNKEMSWLRLSARAVEEAEADARRYEQICLQNAPYLADTYNDKTGHHMAFFHLEDATALLIGIDESKKEL